MHFYAILKYREWHGGDNVGMHNNNNTTNSKLQPFGKEIEDPMNCRFSSELSLYYQENIFRHTDDSAK